MKPFTQSLQRNKLSAAPESEGKSFSCPLADDTQNPGMITCAPQDRKSVATL